MTTKYEMITLRSPVEPRNGLILAANAYIPLTLGPFDYTADVSETDQPLFTFTLPYTVTTYPRSFLLRAHLTYTAVTQTETGNSIKIRLYDPEEPSGSDSGLITGDITLTATATPASVEFPLKSFYKRRSQPLPTSTDFWQLLADATVVENGAISLTGASLLLEFEPVLVKCQYEV